MSKRPAEDPGPPTLRVSVDAAVRELEEQVAAGVALRPKLTSVANAVDAKRELDAWTTTAADVIEQVFTGRSYWADFQHVRTPFDDGVIRPRGPSRPGDHESTDAVIAKLDERVRVLRELIERAKRLGRFAADRNADSSTSARPKRGSRTVFVVHGRDLAARDALAAFLRSLQLEPLEWEQAVKMTGKGTPTIWEVVETGIQHAGAVAVLLTGDDEVRLRAHLAPAKGPAEELSPQPRPNVLLEMGMALMNVRERTVLLRVGELRRVTDIDGMHILPFDNDPKRRKDIVDRLRTAGCSPLDSGKDWMSAGVIEIPPERVAGPAQDLGALDAQGTHRQAQAAMRAAGTLFNSRLGWAAPTVHHAVYDNKQPGAVVGQGSMAIDGETLRIRRDNAEGRLVVAWDRSLVQPRRDVARRRIRVSYEAMASEGSQRIQFILKRESQGDWNWLFQEPEHEVAENEWKSWSFETEIDAGELWYFRVDSVAASAPNARIAVRRLLVEDVTPWSLD